MRIRHWSISVFVLLVSVASVARAQESEPPPPYNAAQIQQMLHDDIDVDHRSLGIVIGVIDAHGQHVYSHGVCCDKPGRPLDGDTIFEVGSVTKAFTAVLLAGMVQRGEVALDDPVAKYLSPSVTVPSRNGRQITLRDLVNHTSGLPRMPSNLTPNVDDYTLDLLYKFLSGYTLARDPGATREYSNLGFGILGVALSRRAGMSYEELVRTRITKPLHMDSTFIRIEPKFRPRMATGHDEALHPMADSSIPAALEGAGAIRSTVNDLLKFVAASAGLASSNGIDMTWGRDEDVRGLTIVAHDGSTDGFSSFIMYDRKYRRSVALLSNSHYLLSDLAVHLLQPKFPLIRRRTAIELPAAELAPYTGGYRIDAKTTRTITRYRNRLFIEETDQPIRELFAQSKSEFFVDDARHITFERDANGAVSQLTYYPRNGLGEIDARIEQPAVMSGSAFVEIEPSQLDRYVGEYRFGPDDSIRVTRDGDRLFAQISGQSALEIFPISEKRFRYIIVPAEIEFRIDESGAVSALTLFQNGEQSVATRVVAVQK